MVKTQRKSAPNNERLAEVYRTAAQIILRKGYDATSINDIANALGMTKAGLYHYINGKKELLFDIMNFGLDELDEEVVTPACSIADASSRLRFIITSHARLVMGTSMGGMHTWLWGETHPDFMDALMPLASLPTQISGRNRAWRRIVIDAIRNDPDWRGGD